MKSFIGFDLGTTNIKALLLHEDGSIGQVISKEAPVRVINGVKYYDLESIELELSNIIEQFSAAYSIRAMAFTSIGESVVPVKQGKMMHLPLMWNENVTDELFNRWKETSTDLAGYSRTGVVHSSRLSLYKILWMREHLHITGEEYWLPVSSYFAYRFTGKALWSESQACRTDLYDIHTREWITELTGLFDLDGKLGDLAYTGSSAGESSLGITVGVAGHDHITGMYGVHALSRNKPIFFDSMGTASVLGAVIRKTGQELHFTEPFFKGTSGVLGAAFADGQFYIQNSFRYFGYLLDRIALSGGFKPGKEYYARINEEIKKLPRTFPAAFFSVGGDCLIGSGYDRVSMLGFPVNMSHAELMQSGYIYLCVMSRMILDSLLSFCPAGSDFFAGGKIVKDELFMRYKASLLGRRIITFDTGELVGLGAAIAAASACGEEAAIESCAESIKRNIIEPDDSIAAGLNEAYAAYLRLGDSPLIQNLKGLA